MKETTPFGSLLQSLKCQVSLPCFESTLGPEWKVMHSEHSSRLWMDEGNNTLMQYCEGDVDVITAPDLETLKIELNVQLAFMRGVRV